MRGCSVCNKDTGWFGGYRCEEHNSLFYGDEVIIVEGFHKGQKGRVINENKIGTGTYYDILLSDGHIIDSVNWGNIENVKLRNEWRFSQNLKKEQ